MAEIGKEAYILALGDGAEVDLGLGHGQNVGRGRHVDEELYDDSQRQQLAVQLNLPIGRVGAAFDSHWRAIGSGVAYNSIVAYPKHVILPPGLMEFLTLNSALGAGGSQGADGTDHEVGKDLVAALGLGGHVLAKVGDLGALGLALEGAAVAGGAVGAHGGAAQGAHSGHGGLGRGAQAQARSSRKSSHCAIEKETGGVSQIGTTEGGGCWSRRGSVVRSFSFLGGDGDLCRKFWDGSLVALPEAPILFARNVCKSWEIGRR